MDESGRGVSYLIDRKNEYHRFDNSSFHLTGAGIFPGNTLINGEIVTERSGNYEKITFMVFDCPMVNGEICLQYPLGTRLAKLQDDFPAVYSVASGETDPS
ncbi:hypothetical protein ACHAQJ_009310 [Trichoderma viride]